MSATEKPNSASTELRKSVDIRTLEPIIFYSGKSDELHIHLGELDRGELIIKLLSKKMMQVKEVTLLENAEELSWKQDFKALKIIVPKSVNEGLSPELPIIIKIKF
ncbi:hypothetical protein [Pedobacter sp.]|uniref:hypothetical protein n=1 Tax=Pedobacter sp. TaxID=1411316 RepID=UPI003BA915E9